MIAVWITGLFTTRWGRMLGMVTGVALTVALLCDVGTFIQQSSGSMTARAIASVPIDWQVQLVPGSDAGVVSEAIRSAVATTALQQVGYAAVDGFEFKTVDGSQSTGPGKVVGIGPDYVRTFPAGFRMLAGDTSGAILLQQTAANLHAVPGDSITVRRPGLANAKVTITGVVDLKSADTVFQAVGVPAGAAPQAPPDNAVILPIAEWHKLFDPQATLRPDSVRVQIHAIVDHATLPANPSAAYQLVTQAGHNLEVRVAGSALLANNIAAQLDAARGDALYARVLFLFLGSPGIILAGLLTMAIARAGFERRRRDQSLLRLRGASLSDILGFCRGGSRGRWCPGRAGRHPYRLGLSAAVRPGNLAEWSTFLGRVSPFGRSPARRDCCRSASLAVGSVTFDHRRPSNHRATGQGLVGTDLSRPCLSWVLAALVFAQTAASGYQVVLATEGVTAVSVDYTAFLPPVLLWIGSGLLTLRLVRLLLGQADRILTLPAPYLGGDVAAALVASLYRQRRRLASGVAFAALAVAFAVSTSVFNTTYQGQARVDALLTNGADVTVTGSTAAPAAGHIDQIRRLVGVAAAEPMQHRFAYVGTDLQDLYGIDPTAITNATPIVNAYFANRDASGSLATLARQENAAFISDETATDFQLTLGDTINLRLQSADGAYHPVPFVFAGIVREFPTAPRDSFIVANAAYVAKMTGVDAAETVLIKTSGDPLSVKAAAIDVMKGSPGAQVTALADAAHIIGSSLTAVDLSGLTRLELTFAVVLGVGATALILALGLADRRRSFAILTALGANTRQLGSFILAEGVLVLVGGLVFGTLTGGLVAPILVTVLQGVFDPPPEALSVPWVYLAGSGAVIVAVTTLAMLNALRDASIEPIRRLRELQ